MCVLLTLTITICHRILLMYDFSFLKYTGTTGINTLSLHDSLPIYCDTAAGANLTIIVAPLIRSRIPTVIRKVTTIVTPGESVDVLVTDHGIAVNPARPEIAERLKAANLPVMTIEELYQRAIALTGEPKPIEFNDKIVGIVHFRDGSIIDVVDRKSVVKGRRVDLGGCRIIK